MKEPNGGSKKKCLAKEGQTNQVRLDDVYKKNYNPCCACHLSKYTHHGIGWESQRSW